MAGSGRISTLVSKDAQVLLTAIRQLPDEAAAQNRKHTRIIAEPVWKEAVTANVVDRLQTRVFADTARVAVADSQVTLKAGGIGRLSSGTSIPDIVSGVEFGADPNFERTVTNRQGTTYRRHTKRQFNRPRSRGYVVFPAAREVIPRIFALWFQTTVRTVHETFEKGGAS